MASAQAEADRILAEAREQAARLLADGREQAERVLASGGEDLEKLRADSQAQAQEIRANARSDAREIVGEAHVVAREVLREGNELSRNLRELSVSLRNNAERILSDVRLAHGGMTARLDQAGPGAGTRRPDDPGEDLTCRSSFRRGERRTAAHSRGTRSLQRMSYRTAQSCHIRLGSVRFRGLIGVMPDLSASAEGSGGRGGDRRCRQSSRGSRRPPPLCDGGRYDLVIDIGEKLLRVQCKWASRQGNVLTARSSEAAATRRAGIVRTTYSAEEIDAIAVYAPDTDCCSARRSARWRAFAMIQPAR